MQGEAIKPGEKGMGKKRSKVILFSHDFLRI